MKAIVALAFTALLVSACGSAPKQIENREDYLKEGTRTYQGVSREKVIAAAEQILRQSDPKDWTFQYTPTGFVGHRDYFLFMVIASARGQERWEFTTEAGSQGGVRAAISVSESGVSASGATGKPYQHAINAIPLYRLFWARMDYMLGRRADWPGCEDTKAAIKAEGGKSGNIGGLCGSTSDGRNAPAPQPLVKPAS